MNFLVSIVVPIYNSEKYIGRCINSIINQSYRNLEIILINDGSKDNSLNICKKFAKQDKRIILLNQNNNGVSAARNAGIDIAKGEYISFIDADDSVEKNYIYELVKNSNNGQADVVICGYNDVYSEEISKINTLENNIEIKGLINKDYDNLKKYIKYPWIKIYRLNFLKNNNIKFSRQFTDAEDQVFNFQVFSIAKIYNFVNKALYNHYYSNLNSLSKQITIRSFYSNLEKLKFEIEKKIFELMQVENKEMIFNDSGFFLMRKYVVINDISDNYFEFKNRVKKIMLLMYKKEKYKNLKRYIAFQCLNYDIIFPIYFWYLLSHLKGRLQNV